MRPRLLASTPRLLISVALAAALCACGGGGSGADAPITEVPPPTQPPATPTDPTTPVAPTAAFTASATTAVQAPIAFDATASKAADGSALQYVWDFGDGVRGGGVKIAHAFAAAGTRSVTLTVIDAGGRQGKVTRGVEVTAAAAAVGSVIAHVAISDSAGIALPGVVIGVPGNTTPLGTTDGMGLADVTLDRGPILVLRLTKSGYADLTQIVQLPTTLSGTGTRITAVMRPRDAAQTLPDAHVGGQLTGRAGATITLPADALVNAAGAVVTGAVPISMTAVDPTLKGGGGFPGRFDGVTAEGTTTPIVSFGTVQFMLGEDGNRLQLAPGKTATIELPLMANRKLDGSAVAVGDVIPLWSLDETTGLWAQEGTGTVVANAASPSGLAMRAVVSHFTWWNCDQGFEPYYPDPDCPADFDGLSQEEKNQYYAGDGFCFVVAETNDCPADFNALTEEEKQKYYAGDGHCFEIPADNANPDSTARRLEAKRYRPAAAAATTFSRIAGYSRSTLVPNTGGVPIAVPANNSVYLTAFALNGTWVGQRVVNGAVGGRDKVSIKMRPIKTAASTAEAITLPFAGLARATTAAQPTSRFSFNGVEMQTLGLQVGAAPGGTLRGIARVLQGTTVLASASFSGSTRADMLVRLPTTGSYILEVTPDEPGTFAIYGQLLGTVRNETIGFPASVAKPVDAYGAYRATFDLATATTAHLAVKIDFNNAGAKGELRLAGPDGTVLWTRSSVGTLNGETTDVRLAPGRYTLSYWRSDDRASSIQISSEVVDWAPVADGIPVADSVSVIDLVADRNGRPVVGVLTHPIINQIASSTIQLKRFNGTGWEDVGGPLAASALQCGNHTTSIAFDSTNTPTIAYTTRVINDVYTSTVRRLVGGVWQAVGPNDGALPGSGEACDDTRSPRLVIDAADRPIVAYKGSAAILIRRFDGTDWNKLAVTAQDAFSVVYSAHDLAIDPAGVVWFALRGGNGSDNTVVRRFDVPSGLWQTVGPNAGTLPESNTMGFSLFRFGFDSTGRPVIGGAISVFASDRNSTSGGTAVYRFDGTNWLTTGGYQLPGSTINNSLMPGFAMLGNDALMSWTNSYGQTSVAGIVQRNTASGWSGYGIGPDGQLAAYVGHGPTPDRTVRDSRLLVVGSDVYMAVDVPVLSSSTNVDPYNPVFNIVLLKKTP
ncbi:hypothetical protein BH09PSE6_BH09PSE6_03710 [soil metagenome]